VPGAGAGAPGGPHAASGPAAGAGASGEAAPKLPPRTHVLQPKKPADAPSSS
jgi:hypothetical protein